MLFKLSVILGRTVATERPSIRVVSGLQLDPIKAGRSRISRSGEAPTQFTLQLELHDIGVGRVFPSRSLRGWKIAIWFATRLWHLKILHQNDCPAQNREPAILKKVVRYSSPPLPYHTGRRGCCLSLPTRLAAIMAPVSDRYFKTPGSSRLIRHIYRRHASFRISH